MTITLQVTRHKGVAPFRNIQCSVEASRNCRIGRGSDNDLMLPDAAMVISKYHAEIVSKHGQYFLRDLSTNGTSVNHGTSVVGKGNEVELRDGDLILAGDYEIVVALKQQTAVSESFAATPQGAEQPMEQLLAWFDAQPLLADTDTSPSVLMNTRGMAGARLNEQLTDPFATPMRQADNASPMIPDEYDIFGNPPAGGIGNPFPASPQALNMPHSAFFSPQTPKTAEPIGTNFRSAPEASNPDAKLNSRAAPHTAPSDSRSTQAAQRELLLSFLRGAGLDEKLADSQGAHELLGTAGLLLREMTSGLMRTLESRADSKKELHVEVTTIRSVENNPLKFSSDETEALQRMLGPPHRAYLSPTGATREAVDDIRAHQLALFAGLQGAIDALIERFNPEHLEQRFSEKKLLDNIVPGARKARCWDLFKELYAEVAKEADDDFLRLFHAQFAQRYEEQTERLRGARAAKANRGYSSANDLSQRR